MSLCDIKTKRYVYIYLVLVPYRYTKRKFKNTCYMLLMS